MSIKEEFQVLPPGYRERALKTAEACSISHKWMPDLIAAVALIAIKGSSVFWAEVYHSLVYNTELPDLKL